jgi:carotenoid cleavage dioxygenase-like enzyme
MPSQTTAVAQTDHAVHHSKVPSVAPYLQGNFAPVAGEQTHQALPVDGELPKDLSGLLLRNGPNPIGEVGAKHHWFVGDAMLHAVEIADGRARSYRNRFVRTPHVEAVLGLTAAPRSQHALGLQGQGNVNVIAHAGRILALPEVGLPYELDRALHTTGEYDFAGALRSNMTAHPKIDPKTGELLFFGYDFGPVHLRYHRVRSDGTLDRTLEIATPRPTMIHDFGVTQTRVVFMDLPVVFDLGLIADGYSMPFRWQPEHEARIGVMSRDAERDEVRWIQIDPCYVFHVLNAYDDGPRIVMDVVRYPKTFDRDRTGPFESGMERSGLVRFTIDPEAGSVTQVVLDEASQEFPRVNPRVETLPHRYGYAAELTFDGGTRPGFGDLFKHDLVAGTKQRHAVGRGRSATEGVFVPRGPGEDEGYVIATVYDANTNTSDILVIDAQNFAGEALATIHLPVRVPFGFHGNFV